METVRLLLDRGASINLKQLDGGTALFHASDRGTPEIVKLLLDKGANAEVSISTGDKAGETPLSYAACAGRLDVVRLLLDKGAAPGPIASFRTPLSCAAEKGQLELLKTLLDAGAGADDTYGHYGRSALFSAANGRVVKMLVDGGANAKAVDKYGDTPLHEVSDAGAVQALLEAGADPDARGTAKFDSFGDAVYPKSERGDGWTPLMGAVRWEQAEKAAALLDAGADASLRSSGGLSALDLAARSKLPAMEKLLREWKPRPKSASGAGAKLAAHQPSYKLTEDPDKFAVVVGVEKYSNELPDARFAERDTEAVTRHLLALGFPRRNVASLSGAQASLSGLVKHLEHWLPKSVTPRSTVFVYFSGHGSPNPVTGEGYLVPADGDPEFLEATAYPLKKLYAGLAKLPARRVIVALDSCFSGAGGRSVLPKGARPLVTKTASAGPIGGKVAVLSASAGDQISGVIEKAGHGAFTFYLLEGLNAGQEGAVTPRTLHAYLTPKVQDAARERNRDQTPQLLPADGDFDAPLR